MKLFLSSPSKCKSEMGSIFRERRHVISKDVSCINVNTIESILIKYWNKEAWWQMSLQHNIYIWFALLVLSKISHIATFKYADNILKYSVF